MKLKKYPSALLKAELCTTREEAQKILKKTKKLTYKKTVK